MFAQAARLAVGAVLLCSAAGIDIMHWAGDRLMLGVDYYPEAWDPSIWPADAAMMQQAGVTVVRLAEFAWTKMEPSPGTFDFTWLDNAIALLNAHGVRVILGTPTAAPPAWFSQTPLGSDTLMVDINGATIRFGSRQNVNHLSPAFLNASERIITAMVQRYGAHAGVIGWQVDNELSGTADYSPLSQAAFQSWLQSKYSTLDALNAAWGTVFWSHTYTNWTQIPLAWNTLGGVHNPSLALDARRFASDVAAGFLQWTVDLLRPNIGAWQIITHNCMGLYSGVDYATFGDAVDFIAWDNYPLAWNTCPVPTSTALAHAVMRGAKPGQNSFMIMEQQGGQIGATQYWGSGVPELLRVFAYHAIAHGADAVSFFRWRTSTFGVEQHWGGILDQDSYPGARYTMLKQLGMEMATLGSYLNHTRVSARVALLLSADARWVLAEQGSTTPGLTVEVQMEAYADVLRNRGMPFDVIHESRLAAYNLSSYAIIIAPTLIIVSTETAAALDAYASAGGTLVLTMRSGVKTSSNIYTNSSLPGLLADAAGVRVYDFDVNCALNESAVCDATDGSICFPVPYSSNTPNPKLCDILTPSTATIIALYKSGYFGGRAAVTSNARGAGTVFYAGTAPDSGASGIYANFYDWMLQRAAIAAKLPLTPATPPFVEVAVRQRPAGVPGYGSGTVYIVMNFCTSPVTFTLAAAANGLDVLTGNTISGNGTLTVKPWDVTIVAV